MYLAAVGVLPASRRQGVASSLLAPVLARCDAEVLDAYLENSNPKNTSFYRTMGFEEILTLPMPDGCPPVVAMLRQTP